MINKSCRKRTKFYHVPSNHSHLAQPSRVRHSAFVSTAGKVSVRNSFVTVSTQDEPPPASPSIDNYDDYDVTMISDSSSLVPSEFDKAGISVGQRRAQICTYNSVYTLMS
jgi:hypothetical protein